MNILQNVLLYLVLVLALALAWYMGRQSGRRRQGRQGKPESDYFIGLNYLLNDEPDEAVDVFINSLEPDRGSLETHLALGTLLRRRGKVDRSISHLQGLLAGYDFNADELALIKLQLTRSYIAAGLLDRAEKLLEELEQGASKVRETALTLAITVYQMEKDWRKAVGAALELASTASGAARQELLMQASHYYCELAEQSLALDDLKAAMDELRQAQKVSRNNVRVHLLNAELHARGGNHKEALRILQKLIQQDTLFRAEAVTAMLGYMKASGMEKEAVQMLAEIKPGNDTRLIRELAVFIAMEQGDESAVTYILQHLHRIPSLPLLGKAVKSVRYMPHLQSKVIEVAEGVLEQHEQGMSAFRCENCGFELKLLHWSCPGCGKWGTVLPQETTAALRNGRDQETL
jgi:lipopolysaccharide biosynthesis regulator YciM